MYRLTESHTSDISGGEISILAPGKMDTKFSLLLQNMYMRQDNKLVKLPGYKPINDNKIYSSVSGGIEYSYKGRNIKFVGGRGRIYRYGDNKLVEVYKSLTADNSVSKIHFAQMGNKMVCCNGEDVNVYYENDTFYGLNKWTLIDNFVPMKPFVFKNRVWYINAKNKSEAMHSALQDATTIEGYIDFSGVLPQADELIDIKGFLDFICFIFKNHILVYSGNVPSGENSDFSLYQVVTLPGIVSGETNLNVGNYLFLATESGIKNLQIIYPSTRITIGDFSEVNNPSVMQIIKDGADKEFYTCGYWPKENLYFWIFGDKGIVYNATYKAFSRIVFPSKTSQWKGCFNDMEGGMYVLAGGYLHEYGNDFKFNGEYPLSIWKTAWLPLHPYGALCFPKYADIFLGASKKGGSIDVQAQVYNGAFVSGDYAVGSYDVNYDNAVIASKMDSKAYDKWEEDFYMDSYNPTPLRVPLMNSGRFITLTISEKEPVNGLEFTGVCVYSDARRR